MNSGENNKSIESLKFDEIQGRVGVDKRVIDEVEEGLELSEGAELGS